MKRHDRALEVYTKAAKQVIGKTNKKSKPWISEQTWRKVEERKESKQKLDNAKSERLKERWKEGYDNKNREVKRGAREDKRKWLEDKAEEAERAAENGRSKELYTITKMLTGERKKQPTGIRGKDGSMKAEKKASGKMG